MPFQPVPNVVQVQLFGKIDNCDTINDVSFEKPGGAITVLELTVLVSIVSSWYVAEIMPNFSEDWAYVRAVGTELTTATSPRVELRSSGVNGGTVGEAAPNNVSFAIKLLTALRGRSFRGRNYVPAVPNSMVSNNTVQTTWADDLANGYQELLPTGLFDPDPFVWVVVSRFGNGVRRASGVTTEVIGASYTDLTVDSMRTRLPGRGS